MNEAILQDAVLDMAKALGWLTYHTHDSRHSAAGFPDLTLLRPPRLIMAELKGDGGKISDSQLAWGAGLQTVADCVWPLHADVEGLLPTEREYALFTYALWTPREWFSGEIERALRSRSSPQATAMPR